MVDTRGVHDVCEDVRGKEVSSRTAQQACKSCSPGGNLIKEDGLIIVETEIGDDSALNQQDICIPSADHGKEAWLFLLSCFLVEGIIWGFPASFGIFEAYYSAPERFSTQRAAIAAIGTTSTGLCYFGSPLAAFVYQAWPNTRRLGIIVGLVLIIASLVAASFCNNVTGLLATQGVTYALGALAMYLPIIFFIDEWFVSRKGLAYGTMWAGTGVSGAIVPFLMQWLLHKHGYKTTLRLWAICASLILVPCLYFLKPRLPVTLAKSPSTKDFSFTRRAAFWLFETGVILQSLGFFLPQLWIPSFALSLGLPVFAGSLAVALLNVASAVGSIVVGALVDRFHVTVPISLCVIGSSAAAFLFWGLTESQAMLYVFSILWGAFGGGYVSTWSGQAAVIAEMEGTGNVNIVMVLCLFATGKGVGAVVSGPASSEMINMDWGTHAFGAYGTKYGGLIVFTGISALLAGLPCVGKALKLIR